MLSQQSMYDWDGRVERKKLKKEQKQEAKLAARPKAPHRDADGKIRARKCSSGYWLQERDLFYNGRLIGKGWIHIYKNVNLAKLQEHIDLCDGQPVNLP